MTLFGLLNIRIEKWQPKRCVVCCRLVYYEYIRDLDSDFVMEI